MNIVHIRCSSTSYGVVDVGFKATVLFLCHNAEICQQGQLGKTNGANKAVGSTRISDNISFFCQFHLAGFEIGCQLCLVYIQVATDGNSHKAHWIDRNTTFHLALKALSARSCPQVKLAVVYLVNQYLNKLGGRHLKEFFHLGNGFYSRAGHLFNGKLCCHLGISVLVQSNIRSTGSLFGVGSIVTVGTENQGIVTNGTFHHEFLGTTSTHGTRVSRNRNNRKTKPLENPLVGGLHGKVGFIQAFCSGVEGIGILHGKLTATHNTIARTNFVTIFCVDLIQSKGKLLIGFKFIPNKGGKGFLGSGTNN